MRKERQQVEKEEEPQKSNRKLIDQEERGLNRQDRREEV
jgi:hypothetical protein